MVRESSPLSPTPQRNLERLSTLEKRDWELLAIALILLTVFAGGIITFIYLNARGEQELARAVPQLIWLLLFSLMALVLLLNIYLIREKRNLSKLRRRTLAQEIELEEHRARAIADSPTSESVIEQAEARAEKRSPAAKSQRNKDQAGSHVNDLIGKLESVDFEEMQKAIWALGEATDSAAIASLVAVVKDGSKLRQAAIAALRKITTQNHDAATELAISLMREGPRAEGKESGVTAISLAQRRRAPRVLLEVPVKVTWIDEGGEPYFELTNTKVVNAFGALVLLKRAVPMGSELKLTNLTTQATAEAHVVWVGNPYGKGGVEVGLELGNADPSFWDVKAPLDPVLHPRT